MGSVLTVPPDSRTSWTSSRASWRPYRPADDGSLTSSLDLTSNNEIRFGYGANLTVLFPMNGDLRRRPSIYSRPSGPWMRRESREPARWT